MMDNQHFLPIIFVIFPLLAGVVFKISKISLSNLKSIGLATIVILGMFLVFFVETGSSIKFLAFAVLLAGFSLLICQEKSKQTSATFSSSMTILGFALGSLLNQGLAGRLFLCGLLGYAAYFIIRDKNSSFRKNLVLLHLTVAILLPLSSVLGNGNMQMATSLFLSVTFLPLFPFHLPFVGIIENAKGTLSSFWIVVWLAIGLAELSKIFTFISPEMVMAIGLLSLISAFYSSLAALGQKQSNLFVAAATVAHVSLIWGLLTIFPNFPKWGIAFGIAVAFVLGGICLVFSFVRQRYGWQTIGKLPGLASPMPRFGTILVILVSFSLFLPMIPTFSGLVMMPTVETLDVKFIKVVLMFLAVWLGGGWFLIQMLHQTAFGEARAYVPYTDLRKTEVVAVAVLLLGACYSGLFY